VSGVTSGSEMVSAGIDSTGISSVQNVPVSGGAHGSLITVISNGTSANSSATLSLDPSSPLNNTVRVTDTTNEQYLGLPVLVFDVKPQGTTAYLKNVTAIFVPPTCGSCSGGMNLAAAYLYQGSTQVASASVSGGVATFNNINGISLQPNLYTPFTIKVDVTSVNSSGTKFVSSIGSGGGSGSITLQDASGNNIPVSGTAIGNQITVTQ